MFIPKLDKRLSKLSKKSGKRFKRFERIDGEPTVCNPPPGIPNWAVHSGCLENDDVNSNVIDDGHVVELTDPLIDSVGQSVLQSWTQPRDTTNVH